MGQLVRTSMNIPQESLDILRGLAGESNTTMAEVVRRAIALERFLRDAHAKGSKILIKDKDDSFRELLIR